MAKNNKKEKKDSIASMLKKQKARTVQETIPYMEVYQNGMFLNSPGVYSRTYAFDDTNFETENESSQETIMAEFRKVLNKFGHNVTVQYNIINEKVPIEQLEKDYYINAKTSDIVNAFDDENEKKRKERVQEYREEYNTIILGKIRDGRNDVRKTRYITLSVQAPDILIANRTFNTLGNELQEVFANVNKSGVKLLSLEERLSLLRAIFHSGNGENFAKILDKYRDNAGEFSLAKLSKKGMTTKDLIAPGYMVNGTQQIAMGESLVARSFLVTDLPTSLETKFLSEITNIPCAMIASVVHKTKPKNKALKEVKMHNNSIKGEVVKANKAAYKGNYDPTLISEDLQEAREEGSFLVKDLTINNQKLFYSTISVTILANSLDDLKEFSEILEMKASDFSCQIKNLYGQQLLGLKTALPLGVSYLTTDRMLTTEAASAFFPFSIQELMDKNGHFYGLNAITKNMIVYNRRTSALPNGMIFGKAGSGKSFITKGEIIPNLLDYDDDVVILDPDGEYVPIANEFGGTVINMSLKSVVHINPCDLDMEYGGDKDADPLGDKMNFLIGLIESALNRGEELSPYDITVSQRCIQRMYQPYIQHMEQLREQNEREGKPVVTCDPEACPTLVNLYEELLADNSQEGHRLSMVMEPYAIGQYSMFAHKTNVAGTPRFLVYNLKSIKNPQLKNFVMKVCLSDIWNRASRNRDEKKATWVYLDEFYLLCQTEGAATTLQEYFKRIRKYFGIMTGITQDIEDVLITPQGRGMLNNTGFILMMNQSQIGRAELQEQYNISPSLLDYIKDKPPGMGLLYNGASLIPFDYRLPSDSKLYKLMSTKPSE